MTIPYWFFKPVEKDAWDQEVDHGLKEMQEEHLKSARESGGGKKGTHNKPL